MSTERPAPVKVTSTALTPLPEATWPRSTPAVRAFVRGSTVLVQPEGGDLYDAGPGLMLDELLRRLGPGQLDADASWALATALANAMSSICVMHEGPMPSTRDYLIDRRGGARALVPARDHGRRMPSREMMEDIREERHAREAHGSRIIARVLRQLASESLFGGDDPTLHGAIDQLCTQLQEADIGIHWIVSGLTRQRAVVPQALGTLVEAMMAPDIDTLVDEAIGAAQQQAQREADEAAERAHQARLVAIAERIAHETDVRERMTARIVRPEPAFSGPVPWNPLDPDVGQDVRSLLFTMLDPTSGLPFGWPYACWQRGGRGLQIVMVCGRDLKGPWEIALSSRPPPLEVVWTHRDGVELASRGPTTIPTRAVSVVRPCPPGVPLRKLIGTLPVGMTDFIMADIHAELDDVIDAGLSYWEPVGVDAIHVGVDGSARVLAVTGDVDGHDVYAEMVRARGVEDVRTRVEAYRSDARSLLELSAELLPDDDEASATVVDDQLDSISDGRAADDTDEDADTISRTALGCLVQERLDPELADAWAVARDMASLNRGVLMAIRAHHLRRVLAHR